MKMSCSLEYESHWLHTILLNNCLHKFAKCSLILKQKKLCRTKIRMQRLECGFNPECIRIGCFCPSGQLPRCPGIFLELCISGSHIILLVYIKVWASTKKLVPPPWGKWYFFCAAILHPLLAKMFKSETTFFQYFSPKIPKIQKVWTLDFGKWGQKDV